MSDKALHALALDLGLDARWTDVDGVEHEVSIEALRALAAALGYASGSASQIAESREYLAHASAASLPPLITALRGRSTTLEKPLPANARFRIELENGGAIEGRLAGHAQRLPPILEIGYHRVAIDDWNGLLAVAPTRCFSIDDLPASTARRWGLAAQIYALRREGDGGIGNYGALGDLAVAAAKHRADAIAMSPVHAMFSAAPERRSPYSPSSRLFLNALLVDPRDFFDTETIARAQKDANNSATESDGPTIDWPAAGRAKLALLGALHRSDLANDPAKIAALAAFHEAGGDALRRHAEFETQHARFMREGGNDWRAWIARDNQPADEVQVDFHIFLQWLAAKSLALTQGRAREAGMALGLISDLAVGSDPEGSDAWMRRDEMLDGATIGAPPDFFNAQGQSWGLTTVSPLPMRAQGFRTFIDILRASMRLGGGVRIDHVMSLMRLWIVPDGASPLDGAYLHCPFEDLLRLVALESWRHRCIVVGEDLGVVPSGFRERMRRAGILGTDVLFFMRKRRFLPPRRWRRRAVAMTTTHDLPTLSAWWRGLDIEIRERIGLMDTDASTHERERRVEDRVALADAIDAAGTPKPLSADSAAGTFVDAAIGFVGASRADLALVPLEDAFALDMQTNVPGTVDTHPNWRQRLPAPATRLLESESAKRRLHILAAARTRT